LKSMLLKEDKVIKKWLAGIKATEQTQKSYLQAMQCFTDFTGRTPEELLLEAEDEIRKGLLMRERSIDDYLLTFRESLESQNLSQMTVKSRVTAVCSFYKRYNIQLPYIPKSTRNATPEIDRMRIPTKDDIRELLVLCNPLERALILVGASSGLSVTDICNLKISDFKNTPVSATGITTLHLIRKKVNYEFYTFLSAEATKAVNDYLSWRNRKGKNDGSRRSNQLKKQNVILDSGYLFISQMVSDDWLVMKNEKAREELRKFDEQGIMAIYRRLSEEAGKNSDRGKYTLVRSHNLRRFFNSTMLAAGAPIFYVDYFLGHKLDKTHQAYFRADPDSLREEYSKYVQYLTIEKPLDYSGEPEYVALKEEVSKLKSEKANLFDEMRKELDKLKQLEDSREKEVNDFMVAFSDPTKRQKLIEERKEIVMSEADAQRIRTDETAAAIYSTFAIQDIILEAGDKEEIERKEVVTRLGKTLDELISD
jgi:integrase